MADAKPKREAPFMQRIQRRQAATRGEGITRIDIRNRTADHELLAIRQQKSGQRHGFITARFRIPEAAIAKIFHAVQQGVQCCRIQPIRGTPNA